MKKLGKEVLVMRNNNFEIKNRKDAFMVIKGIEKVCKSLLTSEKDIFVNELNKTDGKKYRSTFGLMRIRVDKPKTVKTYTDAELEQVNKIDKQIEKLKAQRDKLGTTIVLDSQPQVLVMDLENTAEEEAARQLKPIIYALGNKTLINMIENIIEE